MSESGVRFCRYLLVELLVGWYVCFSDFVTIFRPLPVSLTIRLCDLLSWIVCLPGLSDQFKYI